jgi:hypothetical protein
MTPSTGLGGTQLSTLKKAGKKMIAKDQKNIIT